MQDPLDLDALLLEDHIFDLIVVEREERKEEMGRGSRSALVLLPCWTLVP